MFKSATAVAILLNLTTYANAIRMKNAHESEWEVLYSDPQILSEAQEQSKLSTKDEYGSVVDEYVD